MLREPTARTPAEDLFRVWGGEPRFWIAWARGEVSAPVKAWLRDQAPALGLDQDLPRLDDPGASDYLARGLEASTLLVEGELTETGLTVMALGDRPEEVRRHFRSAMYLLLEAVGVRMPTGDEQEQARRLLERLAGEESVRHFRDLGAWLADFRDRLDDPDGPDALDHALLWLAPGLGARRIGGSFACHLSFRLHLRARLLSHCLAEGWMPEKGESYTAFARLDRDRMADVLAAAAVELKEFWHRIDGPLRWEPVARAAGRGR
jgi:hypothetical protein